MASETRTYLSEETVRASIKTFVSALRETKEQFSQYKPLSQHAHKAPSESISSGTRSSTTLINDKQDVGDESEILSFKSFHEWLESFEKEGAGGEIQAESGKPVLNFLMKDPTNEEPLDLRAYSDEESKFVTQSIPYKYRSMVRNVGDPGKVHLIVEGLENAGRPMTYDIIYDRRASVSELIEDLEKVDQGMVEPLSTYTVLTMLKAIGKFAVSKSNIVIGLTSLVI